MAAVGIAQSPDGAADLATLRRVAAAFGLGALVEAQVVAEGLMNRNWRMTTAAGCFAVKQIRDVGPDAARRQHRAAARLATMGLPVPAPLTTRDGDTIAMVDGGWFCVVGWVSGAHRGGVDLAPAQVGFLGALLGKLHNALAAIMPPAPEHIVAPVTDLNTARQKIERYERCVAARATPDAFDLFVAAELRARHALLRQVAHLCPTADAPVVPVGWTHGDFQHFNVLWRGDEVAAVLDWDRLGVRTLATEVVRSATLLFGYGDIRGLDLHRVAAFSAGYRAQRALTDEQLGDGVHRLWWERVTNDLWQLRLHYDNGDTSCDHLFGSASALLAWWSTHRDEVTAAFTGG